MMKASGMHRKDSFSVGKAFEIDLPGVFAAGDAVSGPATVVQAVAHGNHVAVAVDAWLTSGELDGVYCRPVGHDIPQLFNLDDYANARRPPEIMLSPEERICRQDFCEVEKGLGEQIIQEECKRCLRCDLEWLERIGAAAAITAFVTWIQQGLWTEHELMEKEDGSHAYHQ